MNTICLCAFCHRWFWHENPLDAYAWFEKTFPERYLYLQEAKRVFVKRNQEYYERVNKALEENDLRTLMIYKPLDKDQSQ